MLVNGSVWFHGAHIVITRSRFCHVYYVFMFFCFFSLLHASVPGMDVHVLLIWSWPVSFYGGSCSSLDRNIVASISESITAAST